MRKYYITFALIISSILSANTSFAQIPIVYYDFENNASRSTFQNAVEMSVNTPPAGALFTYTASSGACNTIGCSNAQGLLGAGIVHGGTLEGGVLTVGAWQQVAADPTTGAASYYQFSVNTSGFNGISLTFDTKYGNNNAPTGVGVLISNNGTTWNLVGSNGTPNGNTIPVNPGVNAWSAVNANFNLTATASYANDNANLYIRVYTYGATAGGAGAYLSLDNVTILASSTVAGKVFTTLDESNYYTGYTSGLTGTTLGRNSFTATGAGTNVTINGTSGLKMNSGQTFSVASSGAVTFGATGTISGAGGIFNIASGCSLITSNTGGVPSSVTTTGTNVYTAGANYTFNASTTTPFPTGTFGNPANVTINPGAGNTVTLNISPTITGVLSFTGGKLAIGSNTLTLNGTVSGMSATNLITGSATSNLSVGGTGALGTLFFDQTTDGTTNNIATLTLNRASSGTITLGNKLVSGTACTLTAGQMVLNGQTLALNGTFSGSAASNLIGSSTSILTIGGSGALGTLFFDQSTPGTTNAVSTFTLNRAASGTATLGNAIRIGSSLNLTNGTLADGGNIITLAGNITGTAAHGGAGKISMITGGSTISSASLGNLELNNAGGFSLSGSPSVGGTLTLLSGKLTLGTNNLVLGLASAIAGTPSSSNMIVANSTGKLRKLFSANGSFLYPIGDNTNYTPITLNFTSGAYAVGAYTEVNVKTIKHPNNANTTDYLNRYWSVATSGITSPAYSVTAATYVVGDVTGTEANISTGQYTGALPWVKFGATNTGTHTLSSTTVTNTSCDFSGITTAAPTVSSSPNSSICTGSSATLSASGATGDPTLIYQWAPATGLSATTGSSVVATPPSTTTYTLTMTDGNGFTATANTTVSVSPLPAITGNTTVCIGVTNTLSNASTGGTWSSSDITKATIGSSSGDMTGVAAGNATITYTLLPGCYTTTVATVNPLPAALTGNPSICLGYTTTLGHPVSGGTWVSSASGTASVDASGIVTGVAPGTATITYTLPTTGCKTTINVTVQPTPAAITGTPEVCVGLTTPLSHAISGGTWASNATGIATIDASGIVTGVTPGNATITYTVPVGCTTTIDVTVDPLPAAITGTTTVCQDNTTTLSTISTGGTWSSSASGTASVNSSGVVTGVLAGNATITYTLSTGCITTTDVTVYPTPAAITGTAVMCYGNCSVLSHPVPGGTWASSNLAAAVIDASGVISCVSAGYATITYTVPTGCIATLDITINPLPANISGPTEVCEGATITLTDFTTGGTWSSSNLAVGTVDASGVVTGITAGTTTITYTLPTSCSTMLTVTVNPLPAAITGAFQVCESSTTTLSTISTGGTWSSSDVAVGTVDVSGTVSGILQGTTTISYTFATGCSTQETVTVNPLPGAITGSLQVCVGATSTLGNPDGGGTWASSNTFIATIGSVSGIVDGQNAGNTNITYTLPTGCSQIAAATVDPLPATITGINEVCEGNITTLYNSTIGGTWSVAAIGTATVNATTGEVTGITAGITTVSYILPTGCYAITALTVDAVPPAITGSTQVCHGSTTTLTNTMTGGTWSSSNTAYADIDAAGIVTGVAPGASTITYMMPTGCMATQLMVVNPLPAAITGTASVCVNSTTNLFDIDMGGTWSSSNPGIGTVDAAGVVTGIAAGTTDITYTLPTSCYITALVTVLPLPAAISGSNEVCKNSTITLTDTDAGGTWGSSNTAIATVSSVGVVSGINAGVTTITYTLGTGCYISKNITVNPLPAPISGPSQICTGETGTYTTASTGIDWASSNVIIANINSSGIATGLTPGALTTICYFITTGCSVSKPVTVNPTPPAIVGNTQVCQSSTTTLTNSLPGGTWSSSNPAVAGVNSLGVVSGVTPGICTITYTMPTGCKATQSMIVNPPPSIITGTTSVCIGSTTNLNNSTPGGTWSSSNTVIGTIDATGSLTGINAGNTTITYMLGTGCYTTRNGTINTLPATITGNAEVCHGLATPLASTPSGGTWSSSNVAIAYVNPSTGVVVGSVAGVADITYTLPTGCKTIRSQTVNPLPAAITGTTLACVGQSSTLSDADAGGTWISGNASIASVDALGNVTAIAAGTGMITYMLPTGCITKKVFTVNPLPAIITGNTQVCQGLTTTLHNTTLSGTWGSSNTSTATVTPLTGIVSGVASGSADITYTAPNGCNRIVTMTVNPTVSPIVGAGAICNLQTLSLSNPDAGGIWISSNTAVATVSSITGLVTAVNAGTTKITYTLPTGCLNAVIITVNPLPALIGGTTQVCAGGTTSLSNSTPGGTWSIGTTGVASISATGVVSSTTAGIATVTYTLSTGCARNRDITVNAVPTPQTVTGGGSYCAGGTGVHIGLGASVTGITYKLYRGSILAATTPGTGLTIDFGSYTVAGTYTVQATAVGTGCINNMTGNAIVTITPLVTPSVSMSSSMGDTLCGGTSTTFTATPVNGGTVPTYQWFINSAPMGAGSTFIYTPLNGDSVMVKMTSNETCPSPAIVTMKKRMEVIANQMPSITITKTSSDSICAAMPVSFHAVATWGGNTPVYTWRRNGIDMATGINYSYLPTDGDVISCRLTSNFRCRLADEAMSNPILLHVDSVYIPSITVSAQPGLTIAPGTTATLTATVTGAGPSPVYTWKLNGSEIPGANTNKLIRSFSNNDEVTCIVWGSGVCGLPSFNTVYITVDAAAGIQQTSTLASDIKLMPNPNKGDFTVSGSITGISNNEQVLLEVTNMLGQVVYSNKATIANGKIDEKIQLGNTLSDGLYILNVQTNTGHSALHFMLNR